MPLLLRPRYWPAHLAAVAAAVIGALLGLWQLGVWREQRAEAAVGLSHAKPVALTSVMGGDSPFPGSQLSRPVTFHGAWLARDTFYIDRVPGSDKDGFWVVTPVLVHGSRSAMVVVRGASRRPTSPPVTGRTTVVGWLEPDDSEGLVDPNPNDRVFPELSISALLQQVKPDLYSAYVMIERPTTGLSALRPDTGPGVDFTTGLRNFVYALQWWVFGGFGVFVWWRWCRDEVTRVRSGA